MSPRVDRLIDFMLGREMDARTLERLRQVQGARVRSIYAAEVRCRDEIDRAERALATIPLDDD